MKQINTKEPMKTTKGESIKDEKGEVFTYGDALSNILIAHETGGKMKCFILAQKFATEGSVSIDDADLELVKEAVKSTKVYNNLVGQILFKLEEKEEVKK